MKKMSLIVAVAVMVCTAVSCSTYECEIQSPGENWVENTNRIPKFEKEFHVKAAAENTASHSAAAGLLIEETSFFGGSVDGVVDDLKCSFQRSDLYKGASMRFAGKKELNGVSWNILELTFAVKDISMHQDFYLTRKGNRVFTVLYSAAGDDNYRKYLPDFIAMMKKVKFISK